MCVNACYYREYPVIGQLSLLFTVQGQVFHLKIFSVSSTLHAW